MELHYFLFGLALSFTIFASIQDLIKREVANWLNFSLIGFALIYRAFYSIINEDLMFFIYGLIGFAIFFLFANLFYYSKVFAGGDAKLLMGFGIIMPYQNYFDLVFVSIGFIILLFTFGAIYSLIYSTFLAYKNRTNFYKTFKVIVKDKKWLIFLSIFLSAIILIELFFVNRLEMFVIYGISVIFLMPFLYIYLLSIEKSCMVFLTNPKDLTEGDWIEKTIKIGNKYIKKSVHGLDIKDILLLRKYNKKVFIKQGVPFVPAFLFALIAMGFFYLVLEFDFQNLFFYLF